MITIERAAPEDANEIRNVAYQSWRAAYRDILAAEAVDERFNSRYLNQDLRTRISSSNDFFFVARDNNKLVGFIHFGLYDIVSLLAGIYVIPNFWRRGIGTSLLRALDEELNLLGHAGYGCYVHERNEIGKAFFLKHGFVHTGHLRTDWVMIRELKLIATKHS
jgi:RimJ/RimL family protein N-acetyltransferase